MAPSAAGNEVTWDGIIKFAQLAYEKFRGNVNTVLNILLLHYLINFY
jgi:hypothetical protein